MRRFHSAVTLAGGGPVSASVLSRALALAPLAIGADGGARHVQALGHPLTMVIGDLDSIDITENWLKSGVEIRHLEEQETTDFEKCLSETDAPLYLAAGFLGGRADHALAAMQALLTHANKRVLLLGEEDVTFLLPGRLDLPLPKGTRVSLMPLCEVTGVTCEGLRWNVAGMRMSPGVKNGVSNEMTGPVLRLAFDRPGLLVTVPRSALELLVRTFLPKG